MYNGNRYCVFQKGGDRLRCLKTWGWLIVVFTHFACSAFFPSTDTPEAPTTEPVPTTISEPSPGLSADIDKWALWTNGTQLRGANIWQRVVVPNLDGSEFLGAGHVGPPYSQADFDRLAALGANYVNLSYPGLFTERPPYVLDEAVQANLDNLLAMAAQADLFAVITFRTGPGRSDFTFYREGAGDWFDPKLLLESVWRDQDAQDAWVEMWRYTADRYSDNPVVVGYDLMCEPNSSGVVFELYEPEEFYSQYSGSTYDWNHFYPSIVEGIREVDRKTPILVSGMGWGAVSWLPYLEPSDDSHMVYMVHQYEPQDQYTHQELPANNGYPDEFDTDWDDEPDTFDRDWLDKSLSDIDDFKQEHGVPVSVNEFGVIRWVPNAADFMRDEMELFEQRGMNHALWTWDPEWEPWTQEVNEFNFRFGPDPKNATAVENDLQDVITDFWARNRIRPSSFVQGSRGSETKLLEGVTHWFYFIGDIPDDETIDKMVASDYDMLVLDFIPSVVDDEDYPMAEVIDQMHDTGKLVLAYIDIGEAEAYRVYWKDNWRVGNPTWIVGEDPDGWAENYPVAFWYDEWLEIWLADDGLLSTILEVGFDGVYLDWVEAYSDENVVEVARQDDVDPVQEMIWFVADIHEFVKSRCAECVVVAQNAAELVENDEYVEVIDALAQEQVWFDGGADNEPEGDCPLPRTDDDIDSDAYYDSLPPICQDQFDEYSESTLHVSSEEYLHYLNIARQKGFPVFTVDYALEPENVAWVYQTSRNLGFIPFVSNRGLDMYLEPVP